MFFEKLKIWLLCTLAYATVRVGVKNHVDRILESISETVQKIIHHRMDLYLDVAENLHIEKFTLLGLSLENTEHFKNYEARRSRFLKSLIYFEQISNKYMTSLSDNISPRKRCILSFFFLIDCKHLDDEESLQKLNPVVFRKGSKNAFVQRNAEGADDGMAVPPITS